MFNVSLRRARKLAVLGACMLSALAVPAVASAGTQNVSTGRAYDVSIGSPLTGTTVLGPDTGSISRPGANPNDPFTVSKTAVSLPLNPLVEASLLTARVHTANEVSEATATIAQAALFLSPAPAISAKLITSRASATCIGGKPVLGGSALGSLTVGTTTYNLAAPPNTVIPLGALGSITINEQTKSANSITVNAVDVRLLGLQVILASARAGVTNCALG
jgi:hypothetical protein